MSAPAFTPGPWRIAKRGEDEAFYVVERDEPNEPSRHAYRVAHVLDYNELQQNAANACLIAAAPDLYAALSNLLADLAPIVNEFHNSKVNGAWPPAPGDARALASELTRISVPARAALAKAQGAQS